MLTAMQIVDDASNITRSNNPKGGGRDTRSSQDFALQRNRQMASFDIQGKTDAVRRSENSPFLKQRSPDKKSSELSD